MILEEETAILALFLEQAKEGGVIEVPLLRAKLEHAVERPLAVSMVYAMLHRDGWRHKQHLQSDPAAQDA